MKRKLIQLLALVSITVTPFVFPTTAHAGSMCNSSGNPLGSGASFSYDSGDFHSWEHPFGCDNNIGNMPQWVADAYCGGIFGGYAEAQLALGKVVRTSHVWAHLDDRVCVYND